MANRKRRKTARSNAFNLAGRPSHLGQKVRDLRICKRRESGKRCRETENNLSARDFVHRQTSNCKETLHILFRYLVFWGSPSFVTELSTVLCFRGQRIASHGLVELIHAKPSWDISRPLPRTPPRHCRGAPPGQSTPSDYVRRASASGRTLRI